MHWKVESAVVLVFPNQICPLAICECHYIEYDHRAESSNEFVLLSPLSRGQTEGISSGGERGSEDPHSSQRGQTGVWNCTNTHSIYTQTFLLWTCGCWITRAHITAVTCLTIPFVCRNLSQRILMRKRRSTRENRWFWRGKYVHHEPHLHGPS